jgi:hypothetical protein
MHKETCLELSVLVLRHMLGTVMREREEPHHCIWNMLRLMVSLLVSCIHIGGRKSGLCQNVILQDT